MSVHYLILQLVASHMRFLAFFLLISWSSLAYATTFMTLCYEDKNIPPFFLGSGFEVPNYRPGATIEILRGLESKVRNVRFKFVRKPWQRCLKEVQKNKVDAVVASYRAERANFLNFPINEQGKVDETLAISMLGTCLVGKQGLGQDVANNNFPISLAVPRGYAVLRALQQDLYRVIQTDSQDDAYQLVLKGLVDGALGLCQIYDEQISGFPYSDLLEPVFPPVDISYGYLALSKNFLKQNPEVSRALWEGLGAMPLHEYYLDYVNNPVNHKIPRY
ncbi:amino acid ABC transporter substrate-binding protein [Pseudoalteromonas luteoviolacea]|uniref:substrate-binding periplasmic protein n=1 Tax=Pseudoalteromonas luteoviolacea TaxID=43657 RepID=UPI001F2CBF8D|nr:transporter substrate-binding domain-containing protein [Pseudoalteromonas luteoviolacea]MCF6439567.1 amino acid ABC transporter substrate-binding protein [Pseudoalteromonas luteoviolacea]